MAVYERTQRESAHVFSRVVDKSQVPSSLTWAAIGCVTASKGELNKIYQCGTTDYLASVFGEPSSDHIALVCASKIIAEDNTMFIIRVAHENSLRGAQAIVSTETTYDSRNKAIGVVEDDVRIQFKEMLDNTKDVKNIDSTLSFVFSDGVEDGAIAFNNINVPASYNDVYQVDENGNKSYSNELCLILSDVLDDTKDVIVTKSNENETLSPVDYETNWFYGDGYLRKSVIVLKPSASVVENKNCNVAFSVKQLAQRMYGTSTPNKVIVPVVFSTINNNE